MGAVFVLREINQNLPLTGYRICLQMWRQPPPGRAGVFACKCGVSPYRDNKTVRIPDKSKFSGRSSRTQRVYTNLGSPANGFGLRNSNRYSGQSGRPVPTRIQVAVRLPAKSKYSVRSAEMRRICTGLGRGRRLSTPRPTQIYTLFYALRAVVAPAPTGIIKPFSSPINQNLPFGRAYPPKTKTPTSVDALSISAQ